MIKIVLQKALTQRQQDAELFLVEPDDRRGIKGGVKWHFTISIDRELLPTC